MMGELWQDFAVISPGTSLAGAAKGLGSLIETAKSEVELQQYIQKHPYLLSIHYPHCHCVVPNKRLGDRYVADFFCLDRPSSGPCWIGVELESPKAQIFTKSGRPSHKLVHAMQQINDWRNWVEDNIAVARNPCSQNGLGLEDIEPRFLGCVIIGRRSEMGERENRLRRKLFADSLIRIRTWDGMVEWAVTRSKMPPYV